MTPIILFCLINVIFPIQVGYCQSTWKNYGISPAEPPLRTSRDRRNDVLADYYDTNDEGICCECIPFYLCSGNGTIIDTGGALIDPRFGGNIPERNVDTCSDFEQFCCKVPTAPENCMPKDKIIPEFKNEKNGSCECIHWEFCLEEFRVSDGSPHNTFVLGEPLPQHSKCNHALEVCCVFDEPTTTAATRTPPSSTANSVCVNPWLCDESGFVITTGSGHLDLKASLVTAVTNCTAPLIPCKLVNSTSGSKAPVDNKKGPKAIVHPRCYGIRNSLGIQVRIGGFKEGESQFGEFPWVGMVLNEVVEEGKAKIKFIGGAILIHPRVLLTAAHKLKNTTADSIFVRVGEWDIETQNEPSEHQTRNVKRVILHPDFDKVNLYHDVALLILTEPVVLQPHIRSICMAQNINEVDTSRCVINGWGEDSFGSKNFQTIMKSVELPFVPHRRCQAMLRRTRLGRWFRLHPSFVCAGGIPGKDACRSDGGGPLACPRLDNPSEYLLVGITAWGIGCGDDGVPGVYSSVIADRNWIIEKLTQLLPDSIDLLNSDREETSMFDSFSYNDAAAIVEKSTSSEATTSTTERSESKTITDLRQRIRIERERQRRRNRRRYGSHKH